VGNILKCPFNQQMSFPYELKLRRFGSTLKLCSLPVREIETLQHEPKTWSGLDLKPGDNPLAELSGDVWDIQTEFDPGGASEVGFIVRGRKVAYSLNNSKSRRLSSGELNTGMSSDSKSVRLRILVDRTTVEVFGNDGEIVISACFIPKDDDRSLKMFATGGPARVASLRIHKLKSAWKEASG